MENGDDWNEGEIRTLIRIWAEVSKQDMSDSSKELLGQIAESLNAVQPGNVRSEDDIEQAVSFLRFKYKKLSRKGRAGLQKQWPFWYDIEEHFGTEKKIRRSGISDRRLSAAVGGWQTVYDQTEADKRCDFGDKYNPSGPVLDPEQTLGKKCVFCRQGKELGVNLFYLPRRGVKQRVEWLKIINKFYNVPKMQQLDIDSELGRAVVCSEHFESGKPSKQEANIDFVPNLNLEQQGQNSSKRGRRVIIGAFSGPSSEDVKKPEGDTPPKNTTIVEINEEPPEKNAEESNSQESSRGTRSEKNDILPAIGVEEEIPGKIVIPKFQFTNVKKFRGGSWPAGEKNGQKRNSGSLEPEIQAKNQKLEPEELEMEKEGNILRKLERIEASQQKLLERVSGVENLLQKIWTQVNKS